MENLIKNVEVAISYHAKSTISKYDILLGDDKLLELIIDNVDSQYEYEILHDRLQELLDSELSKTKQPSNYETSQYDLVSSESVDFEIDKAIVNILEGIDNKFVRNELLRLALASKKMLRAKMYLKIDNKQNYEYAAILELFHLATLIQDDVIDIASTRRHVETINSKFDDRTAILISDYLLVHIGYVLSKNKIDIVTAENAESKIKKYYSELIKDFLKSLLFSEREVTAIKSNKSYDRYASNKTAKFFKVALISGALTNNPDISLNELKAIGEYGHRFGLTFQKVDDLLDYNADITISGKDSRDAENDVNNYILLNLHEYELNEIKEKLNFEAEQLLSKELGEKFEEEIKYLIRRING
ncbi:polyprenyl synthetase family protein [Mollicutes bacterium LVI A0078]|nr:polyprenyl synthetase family protein [Mollicutes bacterium LVI A0075]WOO91690.1 polyprenyl synthetase family protein [Mollicutes bacterium LVI A0078]